MRLAVLLRRTMLLRRTVLLRCTMLLLRAVLVRLAVLLRSTMLQLTKAVEEDDVAARSLQKHKAATHSLEEHDAAACRSADEVHTEWAAQYCFVIAKEQHIAVSVETNLTVHTGPEVASSNVDGTETRE